MSMTPEERAEFLQIYLDETEEELDALVETLLVLEENPDHKEHLNEAFRFVHSMKGAAGMMGLQDITSLTHELESRFEKLRSGTLKLDPATTSMALRCVDYLRECNNQLRNDADLPRVAGLLQELIDLNATSLKSQQENAAPSSDAEISQPSDSSITRPTSDTQDDDSESEHQSPRLDDVPPRVMVEDKLEQPLAPSESLFATSAAHAYHISIIFEGGLKLLDMKGQLIVSRLSGIVDVISTRPLVAELATKTGPVRFELLVSQDASMEEIQSASDVHGVDSVEITEAQPHPHGENRSDTGHASDDAQTSDVAETNVEAKQEEPAAKTPPPGDTEPVPVAQGTATQATVSTDRTSSSDQSTPNNRAPESKPKVAETVRVEIDRLDNLLNLVGELVVNRARFAQIAIQMSPALKRSATSSHARTFSETLREVIEGITKSNGNGGMWTEQFADLEEQLEQFEDLWEQWDTHRQCLGQINEAIDQLTRVSNSLQRGVLQTRMLSVAPLFNRFKRVVRDLSLDRNKKIHLEIRGEKTELDKRMIDELGDPLVHLIRNSIDHGIETPSQRTAAGKPEHGTIVLEASHSGNNVFIRIYDDGGGVDPAKIRQRIIERELLTQADAEAMPDEQVIEYIWHPGFSTAEQLSNISGRGVGMDIVKTRIAELNGTIDVESTLGEGTIFTIRLPLTLAIINSLLFRIGSVVYSVPIDDVRDIVSIATDQVVSVHGNETFCVRGQYLRLVSIEDLFAWHRVDYNYHHNDPSDEVMVNIVILQSAGKTLGLRVDELLGGEDIVIKSLSENFVDIRGLSGASILGDGTVSLLLDAVTVIAMASDKKRSTLTLTSDRVTS